MIKKILNLSGMVFLLAAVFSTPIAFSQSASPSPKHSPTEVTPDEPVPVCSECKTSKNCDLCQSGGVLQEAQDSDGGPSFGPMPFPGMVYGVPGMGINPNMPFCGIGNAPVKVKGISLCTCQVLVNSSLITNPYLQNDQYCVDRDKFFIAKKCKVIVEAGAVGFGAAPGQSKYACELGKASRKQLKAIRWLQAHQAQPEMPNPMGMPSVPVQMQKVGVRPGGSVTGATSTTGGSGPNAQPIGN